MKVSNKELISKLSTKEYNLSSGWKIMTANLKRYLEEVDDLESYYSQEIIPRIFHWPENSIQNINQLQILETDPTSIFYKTLCKTTDYGPPGINLYNNVQCDRIQQVWSIYNVASRLKLDLNKKDEIILEFGAGTGQMADVLHDLNFGGQHIVYDLPLMTVIQRYFIAKRNIKCAYILDDDHEKTIINGTNYLPCNQTESEKYIMGLPNINFIATFSLTETDIETHNKFANYMLNFSRIYIVYSLNQTITEDFIDNVEYVQSMKKKLENTHYCYIGENYGNGNVFMAVKKELTNGEISIN